VAASAAVDVAVVEVKLDRAIRDAIAVVVVVAVDVQPQQGMWPPQRRKQQQTRTRPSEPRCAMIAQLQR
jgi:hypothetical protein